MAGVDAAYVSSTKQLKIILKEVISEKQQQDTPRKSLMTKTAEEIFREAKGNSTRANLFRQFSKELIDALRSSFECAIIIIQHFSSL